MKASRRRFFGLAAVAPVAVQAKVPMVEMAAADIAPVPALPASASWYQGYENFPIGEHTAAFLRPRLIELVEKMDMEMRESIDRHYNGLD